MTSWKLHTPPPVIYPSYLLSPDWPTGLHFECMVYFPPKFELAGEWLKQPGHMWGRREPKTLRRLYKGAFLSTHSPSSLKDQECFETFGRQRENDIMLSVFLPSWMLPVWALKDWQLYELKAPHVMFTPQFKRTKYCWQGPNKSVISSGSNSSSISDKTSFKHLLNYK